MKKSEYRRLQIASEVKGGKSEGEVCAEYGLSPSTVKRAVEWARGHGFFLAEAKDKLELQISELRVELDELKVLYDIAKRNAKKIMTRATREEIDKNGEKYRAPKRVDLRTDVVALDDAVTKKRTLLLELEGLYRQTLGAGLNIIDKQQNLIILPPKSASDDWDDYVKQVMKV